MSKTNFEVIMIHYKKFRLVENGRNWKVYFTHNNEERFIGYYTGHISPNDDIELLLTNHLRDYTDVLRKWNFSAPTHI